MSSLISIGMIAGRYQQTVKAIQLAAETAGVPLAMTLNGVPYFNESDLDRLIAAFPMNPVQAAISRGKQARAK